MTKISGRTVLALAVLLTASPALAEEGAWWLDLSVHGGLDKYDVVGFKSGLSSTQFSDSQQLKDASKSIGATAVARLGMLDVGGIFEVGRPGKTDSTTVVGAMGGINLDVGPIRLEALGEAGGHRYGNAVENSAIISTSSRSDWLAYVGLRPGVAVNLGQGGKWLLGVWGFARWDLTSKDVPVTLQNGGGNSSYKLGGSQFGAALRFGISL